MKKIVLLTGIVTLFATSGCLVRDDRRHGGFHEEGPHYEHHETVVVEHPAVVVRAPEVVVRPPVLIVH